MSAAPDLAALSTALMQVRARARGAPGTPQRADVLTPVLAVLRGAGEPVPVVHLTWVCKAPPSKGAPGVELLGMEFAAPRTETYPPDFPRKVVDLLPVELVPGEYTETPDNRRIVVRFQVTPGHFRCRDCGWGDATDAKGTFPGTCAACAAERHGRIVEWTAKPEPTTETEA